jgi:hypothetical protein
MGQFFSSIKYVNFEDIQIICKNQKPSTIMINTLLLNQQNCLIKPTIQAIQEEHIINQFIQQKQLSIYIIIYGKNNNEDDSIIKKYKQLKNLGFINIFIYKGGLFEWLLLQDIFGEDEFPTTSKENDILKYKPTSYYFINNNIS